MEDIEKLKQEINFEAFQEHCRMLFRRYRAIEEERQKLQKDPFGKEIPFVFLFMIISVFGLILFNKFMPYGIYLIVGLLFVVVPFVLFSALMNERNIEKLQKRVAKTYISKILSFILDVTIRIDSKDKVFKQYEKEINSCKLTLPAKNFWLKELVEFKYKGVKVAIIGVDFYIVVGRRKHKTKKVVYRGHFIKIYNTKNYFRWALISPKYSVDAKYNDKKIQLDSKMLNFDFDFYSEKEEEINEILTPKMLECISQDKNLFVEYDGHYVYSLTSNMSYIFDIFKMEETLLDEDKCKMLILSYAQLLKYIETISLFEKGNK